MKLLNSDRIIQLEINECTWCCVIIFWRFDTCLFYFTHHCFSVSLLPEFLGWTLEG